ncbi:hypothetical protein EXIGLDRAFT_715969 [Exidia glandulosa HHB12029]|uniref:Uncharacterized protein n=1 Tax=Exidia glandulosa HHB12029 TaxID=1314781 RepID=A0A165QQM9_EXIGL|nr:hypothetical protein EXIGLDRAFT_715969 [Exidia glandulosa HHB12029]
MQAYPPTPYYPNAPFFPPPMPAGVGPMTPGTPMFPSLPQRPPQPKPPSSPPPPLRPQDKRAVTPDTARIALQRIVIVQLKAAGFDSAPTSVMDVLCSETEAFMEMLAERAHDYANLASRSRANGLDMFEAVSEVKGLDIAGMRRTSKKRKRTKMRSTALVTPKSPSPQPELLGSDDEGTQPPIPMTLRWNPPHIPKLPPKHTYLRNTAPITKPRTQASSALDRKLANAALVQESLRNLIESTEDKEVFGRDGDILGGVVNWEAHVHAGYKKWKVS